MNVLSGVWIIIEHSLEAQIVALPGASGGGPYFLSRPAGRDIQPITIDVRVADTKGRPDVVCRHHRAGWIGRLATRRSDITATVGVGHERLGIAPGDGTKVFFDTRPCSNQTRLSRFFRDLTIVLIFEGCRD